MSDQAEIIEKIKKGNFGKINSKTDDTVKYIDKNLVDLRGINLSGANLSGVNFFFADLTGADLSGANLTNNVDLRGASLIRTNLTGADLRGTDLAGVMLKNAIIDDIILDDNIYNKIITGKYCRVSSSKDEQGNCIDTTLVNLNGTDLRLLSLNDVNLSEANLKGAIFPSSLFMIDLTGADLTGADLSRANLSRANLIGANLTGANLTGIRNIDTAIINNTTIFDKEQIPFVISLGVNDFDIKYENVYKKIRDGEYCKVSSPKDEQGNCVDPTLVNLNGHNLKNILLEHVNLQDANLRGSILPERLFRTNLAGADLTGADLTDCTFGLANLSGANLSGANLTGIRNIQHATISKGTIFDEEQIPILIELGVNKIFLTKYDSTILPSAPILKRNISSNAPNQLQTNYCWAYVMAKIIHRFFKSILVELKTEEDDSIYCDKYYSKQDFIRHQIYLNGDLCSDQKKGGDKEYKNLILFMFIFDKFTEMRGCDKGVTIEDAFLYITAFFKKYIQTDLPEYIFDCKILNGKHCRIVFDLFKEINRLCNKDCFNIQHFNLTDPSFSYDLFFSIIKNVVDQDLYLYLDIDIKNSINVLFESYKAATTNHAITIVGYNIGDDGRKSIIIKNSWGKEWGNKGITTMFLDEFRRYKLINIIWIESNNKLAGGRKKNFFNIKLAQTLCYLEN
jgi:uncharacterized protein YjbI with pentapeptide repeats